jgi:hypothetical protein
VGLTATAGSVQAQRRGSRLGRPLGHRYFRSPQATYVFRSVALLCTLIAPFVTSDIGMFSVVVDFPFVTF